MEVPEGNGRDGEQLLAMPVVWIKTKWGISSHVWLGISLFLSAPMVLPWRNHGGRGRDRKGAKIAPPC